MSVSRRCLCLIVVDLLCSGQLTVRSIRTRVGLTVTLGVVVTVRTRSLDPGASSILVILVNILCRRSTVGNGLILLLRFLLTVVNSVGKVLVVTSGLVTNLSIRLCCVLRSSSPSRSPIDIVSLVLLMTCI